jgi:hypothetical protein
MDFVQHSLPHAPGPQRPDWWAMTRMTAAEASRYLRDTPAISAKLSRREVDL